MDNLSRLREALQHDMSTICKGVCPIAASKTILFYGKDSDARRIDLANASPAELDHLYSSCDNATFGRGQENVLDESYRKAGKLDLEHFSSTFDLLESRIMDEVRPFILQEKSESNAIVRPELYKLNVYDKGAFFKAHKDTPRGNNMIASLVVVFPTPHKGGALVLRHDGKEWEFDSGAELASKSGPPKVGYVAFFSDVEHEVLPVTSGYRVTLTYNIFIEQISKSKSIPRGPVFKIPDDVHSAFSDLLIDPNFLPEGGLVGFGLSHQYPFNKDEDTLDNILDILKGKDRAIYNLCKHLGLRPSMKVIYKDDDLTVMMDRVVDDSSELYEDDFVRGQLLGEMGGVCIDSYYDDDDYEGEVEEVMWITDMTSFNRTKLAYLAYGNEASVVFMYGSFCFVCKVPPIEDRLGRIAQSGTSNEE